jgi:cytochrome c biogenesis protein ResB
MRGLFMSIHLFSVILLLIIVGVYAPLFWSLTLYSLFFGSLIICETCKRRVRESVKEARETTKQDGLVVMSKTEKAIRALINNKKK